MKQFRLFVNWTIILTCPVWIPVYSFFKSFPLAKKELTHKNKDIFVEGTRFFWNK